MDRRVYGYVRISTVKQKLDRQVDNIRKEYPEAVIIEEAYTGTTIDRPKWNQLKRQLKAGDTVVFDEVSRMSRNAEEGIETYTELYNKGVNLVFLKERYIDTDNYRKALQSNVALTGTDVDAILKGVNEYLMILAKKQIELTFQMAQKEVEYLHQRTSEGLRKAQASGKQVGRVAGSKVETKKAVIMKEKIRKMSKHFDGNMKDREVIEILGITRNTFYKYKKQLKQGGEGVC